jgi:CheY-like chemotaxis protein
MTNYSILMADDDAEDRLIMQLAFEAQNQANLLAFATDGIQVMENLYNQGHQLSLLVLDLNMPKITGTEILASIKQHQRYSHIPVIIYSTSMNPIEQEKCFTLGAHSYITKPLTFDECVDIAKKFIAFI